MENYEDTKKFIRRQIKKTKRCLLNKAKELYLKKEYEKAVK
jgi:hypothetical protein